MDRVATFFIDRSKSFVWKKLTFGQTTMFDILFIILGGLPFYLPILLCLGEANLLRNIPFNWAFWGNQIVSMPHVFATYARLSRKIGEHKVNWALGLPAYLAILAMLVFSNQKGFELPLLTAINVWQSYHYLRQIYGVNRSLVRDPEASDLERRLLFWAYHGAMPLFVIGRWNMLYIAWHGIPSDAIIPVAFPAALMSLLWLAAGCALIAGLAQEVLKYKRSRSTYDLTSLLTLLTYFIIHWFGFLSMKFYMMGFVTITIFHAVQYLGMVWRCEASQTTSRNIGDFIGGTLKLVPYGVAFVIFVAVIYLIGDVVESKILMAGNKFWAPFTTTCLFAISAHHYLVDSFMWRRKAGI